VQIYSAQQPFAGKRRTIVLWGRGTVGYAVERGLLNRGCVAQLSVPTLWHRPDSVQRSIDHACDAQLLGDAAEIHHIYAAGRAGFSAGLEETRQEFGVYSQVLEGVLKSTQSVADARADLHVHLISSAGGLFEGVVGVDADSVPDPKRAYGELKLQQEGLLKARLGEANGRTYRLSSVFGEPNPNRRGSLISNLMRNSYSHRVTRVTGHLDTLRDYIHADDAAGYVVDCVLGSRHSNGPHCILASGRSASILEVLRIIEQSTRRKPFIELAPEHNSASVSFLPSALPEGFAPADLRTRIGVMLKELAG